MDPSTIRTTRTSDSSWQAVLGDREVGRADHVTRLDGRTFVSVDTWDDVVHDALVARLVADLPGPLRTVVGEDDDHERRRWRAADFEPDVRVHAYLAPTDLVVGTGTPPPARHDLVLVAGRPVQPRIRLLTSDPDLARSVLARCLADLRAAGTRSAVLDVAETDSVTLDLLEAVGARRTGTTVELVRR